MNNNIIFIEADSMNYRYDIYNTEIKCYVYSYCYYKTTNKIIRKNTTIKFPKYMILADGKEKTETKINEYINSINDDLETNRENAFKNMGLSEYDFDIANKYLSYRINSYSNNDILGEQFAAKVKLITEDGIYSKNVEYLRSTSKKLKIDIFDLLEMDSDTLNFLYKINPGKIVIHRDPENTNQNTFDFIYVPINVCYCNFDIEKRNKWIKENSRRLFKIALIRLKNDRSFKKFDIPTNFLKATMRIDRDGTALFIFELKDELNNLK